MILLVSVLALAAVAALFWFADDLRKFVPATVALNPTPTQTITRAPVSVVLVATRPPLTATRVPPTATRAITNTPRATATATFTLIATSPAANPASNAARVTETPSPIPTRVPVASPVLISPTDGERIIGPNKRVLLQFQPAQPLGAQEWYRVQVDFLDRAGNPVSWCGFTRESAQEFPRDFFDDSSPNVRSFLWRVNVVQSGQFNPATCDAPYDTVSAPSDVRTFYWY